MAKKGRQVEDEIKNHLLISFRPAVSSENELFLHRIWRRFYSLFIFCDIVNPVVVSDARAPPLLRVVNISGKEGSTISSIYQNIQYALMLSKQFDTIEKDKGAILGKGWHLSEEK